MFVLLSQIYLLKRLCLALLTAWSALTFFLWVILALRHIELLAAKDQSFGLFLYMTFLAVPPLELMIAPFALFIAILYTFNQLNRDSELIVFSASGLSPFRLMGPFFLITFGVTAFVALLTLQIIPWSFQTASALFSQMQADILTRVATPGGFTSLPGGVVFHYRARDPNGAMLGVFIQDPTPSEQSNFYLAERGYIHKRENKNFLILEKGTIHYQKRDSSVSLRSDSLATPLPALVRFDTYILDLARFKEMAAHSGLKPRERTTETLWKTRRKKAGASIPSSPANQADSLEEDPPHVVRRLYIELHDRFASPLYTLALGLFGCAFLGAPCTTRYAQTQAIAAAALSAAGLRLLGLMALASAETSPAALLSLYLLPLGSSLLALFFIFSPSCSRSFPFAFKNIKKKR